MTKQEFKTRWESDENGGGITFDDIANCAKAWGISQFPRCSPIHRITHLVLTAANTVDCDEWSEEEDDYDY